MSSDEQSHDQSLSPGKTPEDTRPFARVGMLVSPPGSYSHVVAEFRDYVRPGETLEGAGERLSILVRNRIRADLKRMATYDAEGGIQATLDSLS